MLVVAAFLTLAATDRAPVVVVVASKRAGADAFATKLAARVHSTLITSTPQALDDPAAAKLLKKQSVDAKTCQGATECLKKAATVLGATSVVIGVDVGKISKNLAVHLEAVAADVAEPLAVADFTASADSWNEQAGEPIDAFIKQVTDKLEAMKAPPPVASADEPIKPFEDKPNLEPPPPTPAPGPLVVSRPAPQPRSKVLPIVFLAAGAASAIVSGAMFGLGMSEKGVVDRSLGNGGTTSELSKSQVDLHKTQGNTYFTISLSTLLVAIALGATGGLFLAL